MESAETLPETVSTLDPYVFTVRFADAADGPIATFEPSSIMLSKLDPPCPPESYISPVVVLNDKTLFEGGGDAVNERRDKCQYQPPIPGRVTLVTTIAMYE